MDRPSVFVESVRVSLESAGLAEGSAAKPGFVLVRQNEHVVRVYWVAGQPASPGAAAGQYPAVAPLLWCAHVLKASGFLVAGPEESASRPFLYVDGRSR